MTLSNYRTDTQYEWTPEQARNGKFEYAKRRVAKSVKGKLPRGWNYKILAPYWSATTKWEIKMDYAGAPWVTLRWRPCIANQDTVNHYVVQIVTRNDGVANRDMSVDITKVLSDVPQILDVVQQIFNGLNPDPIMQLHGIAKRAEKATA